MTKALAQSAPARGWRLLPQGATGIALSLTRNRYLVTQLVRREVLARTNASLLGMLWMVLQPLMMLALYSFVFAVVFKARWPGLDFGEDGKSGLAYAVVLFSGLILHGLLAECLSRAPGLIAANRNYVKKLVFPVEILPWTVVLTGLVTFLVSLLLLMALHLVVLGPPPVTALWIPVIVAPYLLFLVGIVWGVSALGVFIRDIEQLTGITVTICLFLSPVFFPVSALPDFLRGWIWLNPIAVPVASLRTVLFEGAQPDWSLLGPYAAAALAVAWIGYMGFHRLRRAFADVV